MIGTDWASVQIGGYVRARRMSHTAYRRGDRQATCTNMRTCQASATSAHAADGAPDACDGTCSLGRGVSAEAHCARFHKPLPRNVLCRGESARGLQVAHGPGGRVYFQTLLEPFAGTTGLWPLTAGAGNLCHWRPAQARFLRGRVSVLRPGCLPPLSCPPGHAGAGRTDVGSRRGPGSCGSGPPRRR